MEIDENINKPGATWQVAMILTHATLLGLFAHAIFNTYQLAAISTWIVAIHLNGMLLLIGVFSMIYYYLLPHLKPLAYILAVVCFGVI